jgi:glutamine cyclotransferase
MGGCERAEPRTPPEAPRAAVAAVRQVKTYPHDPQAFTQGLVWADGRLYESTGRFGESSLREVTLETGEVVRRVDLPERYFAEGLALLGDRLYQLTWQNGVGFIYDRATFAKVDSFTYQGEGWGLTTDGTSLILSDGSSALRFIDPESYAVTRTVEVKDGDRYVEQLNELEWVKGEVWANVWHQDQIARIDPATGRVKGWLDVAQLLPDARARDAEAVPNGIAYDAAGDRLFLTGKLWPVLFEVSVPGIVEGGGAR